MNTQALHLLCELYTVTQKMQYCRHTVIFFLLNRRDISGISDSNYFLGAYNKLTLINLIFKPDLKKFSPNDFKLLFL